MIGEKTSQLKSVAAISVVRQAVSPPVSMVTIAMRNCALTARKKSLFKALPVVLQGENRMICLPFVVPTFFEGEKCFGNFYEGKQNADDRCAQRSICRADNRP